MELITDRTQDHVTRLKKLRSIGWNNMTESQKSEYEGHAAKGAYNYTDLNRVESAVVELATRFGLTLTTKTDWGLWDVPTKSDMERYLNNVITLGKTCPADSELPTLPDSMNKLTFEDANNIERTLLIVNEIGGVVKPEEPDEPEEPSYINLLPLSIAADGSLYNGGQGWNTGFRLNSSGVEVALSGMEVTGFIPVKHGDTVYLSGVGWDVNSGNMSQTYVWAYDASFNPLAYAIAVDIYNGAHPLPATASRDDNGCLTKFVVDSEFIPYTPFGSLSSVAYIRLNCESITTDSIITVNQPIV